MKQKLEYLTVSVISLLLFEIGLAYAVFYHCAPFKPEGSGIDLAIFLFVILPTILLFLMSYALELFCRKLPLYIKAIPLISTIIAVCTVAKHMENIVVGFSFDRLKFLLVIWPAFVLALLLRGLLFIRWKFPPFAWYIPLISSSASSFALLKTFEMGIFCIMSMLALPIVDIFAAQRAVRRKKNC